MRTSLRYQRKYGPWSVTPNRLSSSFRALNVLKGRAEIFFRKSRLAHFFEDFVGMSSQRCCRFRPRSSVLRQPEILQHQSRTKSSLVIIGGGDVIHDTGYRVVSVN